MPADPTPARQPAPLRRRLHQLPAPAREMLVALSWTPAALRSLLERLLGRERGNPVQLLGSDADVLASLNHDLAQRNAISEALQRQLALRHTLAVQRLAAIRGEEALRAAWQARPASEAPVASLWAVLTHPQGAALEDTVLREMRVDLFAKSRQVQADLAQQSQQQARVQALQAEADALRQRLLRQQAWAEQALQAAQAALAQARGKAAAAAPWPAREPCPPRAKPEPPRAAVPVALPVVMPVAEPEEGPVVTACLQDQAPRQADAVSAARATADTGATLAAPSPVQGRRVLCVGGIQHAVARYRSRVETLGGRFEHHDGGIHDNAHALDGRLARADLVICQAGCINHAAYHRIKQHCQRTGTPCLYLERASLSRFDRALQDLKAHATERGEHRRP